MIVTNYIDIVILLPLVYGLIRGLMRGVVKEIFAILGIVLGVVVARLFTGSTTIWLQQVIAWDESLIRPIAAFVLFMTVAIVCSLLARLLTRLFKMISLGWANRLIGAIFGFAKWLLIVSVIITCLDVLDNSLHFLQPAVKQQSLLYEPVLRVMDILKTAILQKG